MGKKRTLQKRIKAFFFLFLSLVFLVLGIVFYLKYFEESTDLWRRVLVWVGLSALFICCIFFFAGFLCTLKSNRNGRRRQSRSIVAQKSERRVASATTSMYSEKQTASPRMKKEAVSKKIVKEQIDLHIRPLDENDFKIDRNMITTASSIILGTRKQQQDALYVSDTTFFSPNERAEAFGVVCDGMGGLVDGDKASKTAVQVVRSLYAKARPIRNVGAFYADAVQKAQQMVQALSTEHTSSGPRAGTTFVSAIIQNDKLYTAAVGDSRIYIIRKDQIKLLTRDHNYYLLLKEQVQRGEITEEQMNMSSQKEALISYLGMPELKLVDIMANPIQLIDGDVVLLCSDGLTKSLTKEEICNIIINNAEQLQVCAEMLTAAAQRKSPGGLDNTSVILLKYN